LTNFCYDEYSKCAVVGMETPAPLFNRVVNNALFHAAAHTSVGHRLKSFTTALLSGKLVTDFVVS